MEPQTGAAWREIGSVVLDRDPFCNGVLLCGLDGGEEDRAERIRAAASNPVCKGFAMDSRSFGNLVRGWFAGKLNDGEATEGIAEIFERAITIWQEAARVPPGGSLRSGVG